MDGNMVQPQQQWPYWLTQGVKGFDPMQLGAAEVGPQMDGMNIGGAGNPPPPAQGPTPFDQALTGPTPEQTGGLKMGAPQTPEETVARKAGWMQTIQGIMDNPTTRNALIKVGLHMMQPVPVGQTAAGHAAKAGLVGLESFGAESAANTEATRKGAESKSRINLEGAQAEYYRRRKDASSGGGGTAARVQQVKQIAAAFIATNPEAYAGPKGEAQAVLDAQEELSRLEREKVAAGIFKGSYLPGTDPMAAAGTAKDVAGKLATPRTTGTAPSAMPPGAQTGTKDGKRVYTLDGKTFFDIATGKQVP